MRTAPAASFNARSRWKDLQTIRKLANCQTYQRLFLVAGPTMRHSPAMERAIALADATGAALHIAVFIEDFDLMRLMSNSEQLRESCRQENLQWLKDEAELMRRKGINVTTEVALTRDPLQEILGRVAEMQPDLIIKDVHHESALKRVFVTPLDWQLLRECPPPYIWSAKSGVRFLG